MSFPINFLMGGVEKVSRRFQLVHGVETLTAYSILLTAFDNLPYFASFCLLILARGQEIFDVLIIAGLVLFYIHQLHF